MVRTENPDRVHFFQKMLEMRADGVSDEKIVSAINAMGFKTQIYRRWDRSDKENPRIVGEKGGKQLTIKQLQRFILQTEYAGVSYEKWNKHNPVRMRSFNGVVSIDVFNRANKGKIYIKDDGENIEVLHNYSPWGRVKRLRDNPRFPWKCVNCPHCQQPMLGSASTGKSGEKFEAYHCGGMKDGKRSHPYIRIAKSDFDKDVRSYLDGLKFEDGFLAGLELHLLDKYREREKEVVLESSAISQIGRAHV